MKGANRFANRIASITPSGNAGFTTRINTVITPMKIPNTQRPVLVMDADTGSVAMNIMANAKPPMTKCQ